MIKYDDVWVSSGIYWEKHSYKYPFLGITLVHVAWCFYFNTFGCFCFKYHLMQLTWCLRTLSSQAWKACLVLFFYFIYIHIYIYMLCISFCFFFFFRRYLYTCGFYCNFFFKIYTYLFESYYNISHLHYIHLLFFKKNLCTIYYVYIYVFYNIILYAAILSVLITASGLQG